MARMQGLPIFRLSSVKCLYSLPADPGAEAPQAFVDAFVSAVHLLHVADDRAAGRGERRGDQGHPGPNVRGDDGSTVETTRTDHERPVGIAENDPGTHHDQAVDEEQAALEELLVINTVPSHCVASTRANGVRSAG